MFFTDLTHQIIPDLNVQCPKMRYLVYTVERVNFHQKQWTSCEHFCLHLGAVICKHLELLVASLFINMKLLIILSVKLTN